jgi:hypothetical protein
MLRLGSDGEPLPDGTLIFRIGKDVHLNKMAMEQRKALPGMFELSETDKKSDGQRLSVWIEELTIADQGWAFMGAKPVNTVVACLNVDEIRLIPRQEPFHAIDVQWEQAMFDDGTPNHLPGAEGHSGITGLNQGGKGKMDSNRRRALRSMLADMAEISPVPVPHDIHEEQLRNAAYFIDKQREQPDGTCETHWISAIRQLRRARVRAYKESL